MTEPAVAPAAPAAAPPVEKRICEKCRQSYPLDNFAHGIANQACVCTRCLRVMGYKVP